jgi:hypothetical protein
VGAKEVPLLRDPLLLDTVVGTVNRHQTIVLHVVFETAFKHNLWICEEGGEKNDVRGDAGQDNNTINNLPLCLPAQ